MQHCGNCGALLSDEDLRRGSCSVCRRAVTPDIDTVPADARQGFQQEHGKPLTPAPSMPLTDAVAQNLRISVHGQVGIDHGGGIDVRVPAARPRRRGWFFLLGAIILIFLTATVAVLVIDPGSRGNGALKSLTATKAVGATGTAGVATTTTVAASTAVATTTSGGATATAQSGRPGGAPASLTATPASGDTPTPVSAITATALPTATMAPSNPPVLYLNPTAVRFTLCVAASASFTITNTGGGTFKWSAISSDLTLQPPTQGTLDANHSATVLVKGVLLSGTVTVNATDLAGHALTTSPQTFSVICTA